MNLLIVVLLVVSGRILGYKAVGLTDTVDHCMEMGKQFVDENKDSIPTEATPEVQCMAPLDAKIPAKPKAPPIPKTSDPLTCDGPSKKLIYPQCNSFVL
jgi:hypothetical protein